MSRPEEIFNKMTDEEQEEFVNLFKDYIDEGKLEYLLTDKKPIGSSHNAPIWAIIRPFVEKHKLDLMGPGEMIPVLTYILLKSIGVDVFNNFKALHNLMFRGIELSEYRIPSSVQVIHDHAFISAKIDNIIVPKTIKIIEYDAFIGAEGKIVYEGSEEEFRRKHDGFYPMYRNVEYKE